MVPLVMFINKFDAFNPCPVILHISSMWTLKFSQLSLVKLEINFDVKYFFIIAITIVVFPHVFSISY